MFPKIPRLFHDKDPCHIETIGLKKERTSHFLLSFRCKRSKTLFFYPISSLLTRIHVFFAPLRRGFDTVWTAWSPKNKCSEKILAKLILGIFDVKINMIINIWIHQLHKIFGTSGPIMEEGFQKLLNTHSVALEKQYALETSGCITVYYQ